MPNVAKTRIVYVTSSSFKQEENRVFVQICKLKDGTPVRELFDFEIHTVSIPETLESDLRVMVHEEVTKAYSKIRVPCIVEHAGLIFVTYQDKNYPGGLTKPMWKTLGSKFIQETQSAGRVAIARAVIAYCDGMRVLTFVGETKGTLAEAPRGKREFYWDTIFIPDDNNEMTKNKTYAEIVEDPHLGLNYKVEFLSQSSKAMLAFLEHRRGEGESKLWR